MLGAYVPVPDHRMPRIVVRACAPKPIATDQEAGFVDAALRAALLGRRSPSRFPTVGGGSTTTESGNPWRHLFQGTRTRLIYWDVEWNHAGRTYELRVEKRSPAAEAWYWRVQTTRYGSRPLVAGTCLASLRDWVVAHSPYPGDVRDGLEYDYQRRALGHPPPTAEPEPIAWDRVRRAGY